MYNGTRHVPKLCRPPCDVGQSILLYSYCSYHAAMLLRPGREIHLPESVPFTYGELQKEYTTRTTKPGTIKYMMLRTTFAFHLYKKNRSWSCSIIPSRLLLVLYEFSYIFISFIFPTGASCIQIHTHWLTNVCGGLDYWFTVCVKGVAHLFRPGPSTVVAVGVMML